MSTTGFEDGPPVATGAQIGDSGTGIHLVTGILAALVQRGTTGRGQRVSVAMQHAVLNLCRVKLRDQQRLAHGPLREYPNEDFGAEVPRSGNASGGGQPGWAVKCAPGGPNDYIYVIVQPPGWAPITKLIGRPELADDPRFGSNADRVAHRAVLAAELEDALAGHGADHWFDVLSAQGVPCGPINDLGQAFDLARRLDLDPVREVPSAAGGSVATIANPISLSRTPAAYRTAPPPFVPRSES